jgi:hypothetical protein
MGVWRQWCRYCCSCRRFFCRSAFLKFLFLWHRYLASVEARPPMPNYGGGGWDNGKQLRSVRLFVLLVVGCFVKFKFRWVVLSEIDNRYFSCGCFIRTTRYYDSILRATNPSWTFAFSLEWVLQVRTRTFTVLFRASCYSALSPIPDAFASFSLDIHSSSL